MSIATTVGEQLRHGSIQSIEALTQSTATAAQTVSNTHDVTTLGAGTATGTLLRNQYLLATGAMEGMEKIVQMGATGEATLQVGGGTATGALVFQSDGDLVRFKYMNNIWYVLNTVGATLATAT